MSRLKYCPELIKGVSLERNIAMHARIRRRRRCVNVLFLAAAVTTLFAPSIINVDTDNVSFYGLSGQKVEHVITEDKSYDIKRKVTVPLLAGYIGRTNSVVSSKFTVADVSYTGSWAWVDDGNGDFRIRFLTSGTFTPAKTIIIDVFIVGGGGGGGSGSGGGAGSGYAGTYTSVTIAANTAYTITIGSGGAAGTGNGTGGTGGTTSAFSYSKNGGLGGQGYNTGRKGGNGGSGGGGANTGAGGANGSAGGSTQYFAGGTGQSSTTREFGDSAGTLYAGGGGASQAAGGAGGGGNGGGATGTGGSGAVNTGGGGGCSGENGAYTGGAGGSGICVIRNHR